MRESFPLNFPHRTAECAGSIDPDFVSLHVDRLIKGEREQSGGSK